MTHANHMAETGGFVQKIGRPPVDRVRIGPGTLNNAREARIQGCLVLQTGLHTPYN